MLQHAEAARYSLYHFLLALHAVVREEVRMGNDTNYTCKRFSNTSGCRNNKHNLKPSMQRSPRIKLEKRDKENFTVTLHSKNNQSTE
jgi:hypothetical protein